MIIVELNGGLGNQLFQYATGFSVSEKRGTVLKLDVSKYNSDSLRTLELFNFNILTEIAIEEDLKKFKEHFFSKILNKLLPIHTKNIFKEAGIGYNSQILNIASNVKLKGYWQSYLYFDEYKKQLSEQIVFKKSFSAEIEICRKKILSEESVSIHIRRGDYTNKDSLNYHGILPISYYTEAISLLNTKINNCKFYLFSDAPDWAKEHLQINNLEFISGEITHTAQEDFYLMQNCKYNIIANSSFSWWTAYLNKNDKKIIIAPKKWYASDQLNQQTDELCPKDWIRI